MKKSKLFYATGLVFACTSLFFYLSTQASTLSIEKNNTSLKINAKAIQTSFNQTYVKNKIFDVSSNQDIEFSDIYLWNKNDDEKIKILTSLFVNQWSTYLFSNLSSIFSNQSLILKNVSFDSIEGQIIIQNVILTDYLANNQDTKGELDLGQLTINGLLREQTEFNLSSDTSNYYGTITMDNDTVIWDATNWFRKQGIEILNIKPSEFRKNDVDNNIHLNSPINSNDIVNALLRNVPDKNQKINTKDWWEIQNRIDYDDEGYISFFIKFKNINNKDGKYTTNWSNLNNVKIKGFKKSVSWSPWFKDINGSYVIPLDKNASIQKISFNSPYFKNELLTYLNENRHFILSNNEANYSILDFDYKIENFEVKLSNIKLSNNDYLPNAKITNFIFASLNIVPKSNIANMQNNFASVIADELKNSTDLKSLLSNFFQNINNVNDDLYDIKIDKEATIGDNELGSLQITFKIYYKDNSDLFLSISNVFTGFLNGNTKIINNGTLIDSKLNNIIALDLYNNLRLSSENISNFLKEYGCISNILNDTNINVNTSDVFINFNNNTITIENIIVDKYVEDNKVVLEQKNLGSLVIVGFKESQTKKTIIQYSNNYVNSPLFLEIFTIQDLIKYLDNETYIRLLVNIINEPPNSKLTANVVGTPNNDEGTITLSFTLNQYYDEYGILHVSESSKFVFQYQFLSKTTSTSVNNLISLPNSNKYAYEYTSNELSQIDGIVNNDPPGTSLIVDIISLDNRTGLIYTIVKIDKRYAADGSIENANDDEWFEFLNVVFSGAKQLSSSTILKSPITPIDLTANEFIKLLSNELTTSSILEQYIEIQNGLDNTEIIYVKDSATLVDDEIGIVQAQFKLKNFVDNDINLSYKNSVSERIFDLQFSTKIYPETSVKSYYVKYGIDPINLENDSTLVKLDANYIIENWSTSSMQTILKNFIRLNIQTILNSYPVDVDVTNEMINITGCYAADDMNSINLSFSVENCNNGDGTIGKKDFTIKLINLNNSNNQKPNYDLSDNKTNFGENSWLIYTIIGILVAISLVILISLIMIRKRRKI